MTKLLNGYSVKNIEHLYHQQGLSTAKIGKIVGRDPETVRIFMHANNIPVKSREQACTKYSLNSDFFENIDSEIKSYWLGFLTADGGIVGNQIILSLQSRDTEHIKKFQCTLQSNHPIKIIEYVFDNKIVRQPRLVISSVKMVKDLSKYGIEIGRAHV